MLGSGFGQAHAAVYAHRPDMDEVVVFGRTPDKLASIGAQFGFATTTDLDALLADPLVSPTQVQPPTPPPQSRPAPIAAQRPPRRRPL